MREFLIIIIVVIVAGIASAKVYNNNKITTQEMKDERIFVTALIYVKPGQEATFEKYRSRAAALLEDHGARLERIVKPTMLVQGDIELPYEIHFAVFANKKQMEKVGADPEYQKIITDYREPSVSKLIVIPSTLSDFEFVREVGDKSKIYGIALLNYEDKPDAKKEFEEYHDKVCAIMPEFGTHFERFLIPTTVKGDFEQPDEIHRFYFDSMEGLEQMGSDPRMTDLFPDRDRSLKRLNFIIAEAL